MIYLDELEKIAANASAKEAIVFSALDKLAMMGRHSYQFGSSSSRSSPAGGVGMSGMGGASSTPGIGSVNVPGMSIHCAKCGTKMRKKQVDAGKCPKCGADTKPLLDVRTGKLEPEENTEGHTDDGGEVGPGTEDSGDMSTRDSFQEKTSAEKTALHKFWLSPAALKGLAVIGGTGYGAVAIKKALKKQDTAPGQKQVYYKTAAARLRKGNPILNMRLARKKKARNLAKLFTR